MSKIVYVKEILNSIIKSMLETDEQFTMKEDKDSEYNVADNNKIVRKWKE